MEDARVEYRIEQDWGEGWEEVCAEETRAEARDRYREYRENQPGIPVRVRRVMVAPE